MLTSFWLASFATTHVAAHVADICSYTFERAMPPKTPVVSSLREVKDRLAKLESGFSWAKDRIYEIELPSDTVAQELERLKYNVESSLAEMRQLQDSIIGSGKTTKRICNEYVEAMRAHFEDAEESLLKHKGENKRQRDLLTSFVHDKEKLMANAKDIRKLINPLVKQMEEAKSDALAKATEKYEQSIGNISELQAKSDALTEATETYQQSVGNISELQAIHVSKDLQDQVDALKTRVAVFEEVVFSNLAKNGNYASLDRDKVVAGRIFVSQEEAKRSRSASRER